MTDDLSSKGEKCPPMVARWCSFCGMPNAHPSVLVMVAAPLASICNDCISVASQIVIEKRIAAVDRSALSLARGQTPGASNG